MPAAWPIWGKFVEFCRVLRDYVGAGGRNHSARIRDIHALSEFLTSRASHVAQTSLYGYLRTRAGTRFPELFTHEQFAKSIDIAKWAVWLACLSDLTIYAGGLVLHRSGAGEAEVGRLMSEAVDGILTATGIPEGAGSDFPDLARRVKTRMALCDWAAVRDDATPFAESPGALISQAPIIDDLKRLDDEIVRNSVRFRWQEVRRELRRNLDAEALLASMGEANPTADAGQGGG